MPRAACLWCRVLLVAGCLVLTTATAVAQNREPLPLFAVDLHGASVGLPTAEGWVPVPVIATDTPLPGRGWGLVAGATVYPLRLGIVTLGFGASFSTGKGTGESLTITSGSGSTATSRVTPIIRTQVTSILPQISINFGRRYGWSYLSAGLGPTKVTSSADATETTPEMVVPEAWNQALNFGGGAKWFMKPHLAASFDVRFVKLGSRAATDTLPAAKRTQMITFSAGVSIQ